MTDEFFFCGDTNQRHLFARATAQTLNKHQEMAQKKKRQHYHYERTQDLDSILEQVKRYDLEQEKKQLLRVAPKPVIILAHQVPYKVQYTATGHYLSLHNGFVCLRPDAQDKWLFTKTGLLKHANEDLYVQYAAGKVSCTNSDQEACPLSVSHVQNQEATMQKYICLAKNNKLALSMSQKEEGRVTLLVNKRTEAQQWVMWQ